MMAASASLEARTEQFFASTFGCLPHGIWLAPGRVNLIGEHTDYNEGFALPFAISDGVCVAASARTDGLLAVSSRQYEAAVVTVPLDGLGPGSASGWPAYPVGVAWAMLAAGHRLGGASLAIDADLPIAAGLSSSAAVESAAGLALADLYRLRVTRSELAVLGRRAENDFVGAPTGLMDQLAVLLSRAGYALLLDCRAGTWTPVPLDAAAAGLVLQVIDTRAKHELTDGGYGARRRACEDAARALGARSLRDITDPAGLLRLRDPVLRRRARHVVTENQRVLDCVDLLRTGELSAIGPLLTASHDSLRDDFEVSWPQANAAVEAAIGSGALGARMTGGGFGGSVITLTPADRAADVASAVAARFADAGWQPPAISATQPMQGAHRLR